MNMNVRVSKISILAQADEAEITLINCFSPFTALTNTGVDQMEVAVTMTKVVTAMAEVVTASCDKSTEVCIKLLTILNKSRSRRVSVLLDFYNRKVSLRTRSGTQICLSLAEKDVFHVEVDFGKQGSRTRAMQILEECEVCGIQLDAYSPSGLLRRAEVLTALHQRAVKQVVRLDRLVGGDGNQQKIEKSKTRAESRAKILFAELSRARQTAS